MLRKNSELPKRAGCRILIGGTGGQGVVTAAKLLTDFFVRRGQQVVSSQLHGMAQRGGAVQSCVMIDCGIAPAPALGGADVVLGLEPVETARALPFISPQTVVFMNTAAVIPYLISQQYVLGKSPSPYPPIEEVQQSIRGVTSRLQVLDATGLAKRAGSIRTVNVVMLGCLLGSGLLGVPVPEFLDALIGIAPPKLASVNRAAFLSGVESANALTALEGAS